MDKSINKCISIIIPVIHEGKRIQDAIRRLNAGMAGHPYEIIVVDGEPNGSTISRIADPDVKKLSSLPGRAVQMNTGAANASGSILLFLHCDTKLPPKAYDVVYEIIYAKKMDLGAFNLCIDSNRFWFRMIERTASLRSRLTRIPYGDQGFFMRKTLFKEMGGFSLLPIMEDVDFMQRVKRKNKKLFIAKECVKTSPRRWKKEGLFYTTLRNWILMVLYLAGVSPERLARFYRNHHLPMIRSFKSKI